MSFKAKGKQKPLVIFKILAILGQARLQGSSWGQALDHHTPLTPCPARPQKAKTLKERLCPHNPA